MSSERYVFFRLDDVGLPDDAYAFAERRLSERELEVGRRRTEGLLELFHRWRAKAALAVVPWHVTAGRWEWLTEACSDGRFEVAQHGYRHAEHGCREFGPLRSYDEQKADILEGRRLLRDCLGIATTVFVPPSNKYDGNTIRALHDLGFRIISAGASRNWAEHFLIELGRRLGIELVGDYPISRHGRARLGVLELSISVDAAQDYATGVLKNSERLIRDVRKAMLRHHVVGVMLHPWQYQSDEQLRAVNDLLRWLDDQGYAVVTISELGKTIGLSEKRRDRK